MSNTAQGGSNGIVPAGPSAKFDGATAAPQVDATSDLNFASIAPIDHDPPDYPDSVPGTRHLFGNFSD